MLHSVLQYIFFIFTFQFTSSLFNISSLMLDLSPRVLISVTLVTLSLIHIREREEGWEKEKERNIHVGEIHPWLPLTHPQLETWTTAQACALTRNQTSDLWALRPALNPLSYISQGLISVIYLFVLEYPFCVFIVYYCLLRLSISCFIFSAILLKCNLKSTYENSILRFLMSSLYCVLLFLSFHCTVLIPYIPGYISFSVRYCI